MFSIDLAFFLFFLFIVLHLTIGWWTGRKVMTTQEYTLSNNPFVMGLLSIPFWAVFVGYDYRLGSLFCYQPDWGAFFDLCFSGLLFVFLGRWVAPKMAQFKGCLTTGEVMGLLYGRRVRIGTGIIGVLMFFCVAGTQMKSVGEWIGAVLDIPVPYAIMGTGMLILCYMCYGGMKSITFIDLIKWVMVIVSSIGFADLLLHYAGGGEKVLTSSIPFPSYGALPSLLRNSFFRSCLPFLFFAYPMMQRMLIEQHPKRAQKMLYLGGICYAVVRGLLLLGIFSAVAGRKVFYSFPTGTIIEEYFRLTTLPAVRMLFLCGGMAMVLSAIDAFLHAVSVGLWCDVVVPSLSEDQRERCKENEVHYIRLTMIGLTLMLMLWSCCLINTGFYAYSLAIVLVPAFLLPLLFGIFGIKSYLSTLAWFVGCYLCVFAFSWFAGMTFQGSFFVSILSGIVVFFITHYRQEGFFVWQSIHPVKSWKHIARKVTFKGLCSILKKNVPMPYHLRGWAERKYRRYGHEALFLALFMSIKSIFIRISLSFGLGQIKEEKEDIFSCFHHPIIMMHGIGVLMCIGLLLGHFCPKKIKEFFPLYWLFSLGYCIPFLSIFHYLYRATDPFGVFRLTMLLLLLFTLVDRATAIYLAILGGMAAFLLHKGMYGTWCKESVDFLIKWQICTIMLPSLFLVALFASRKPLVVRSKVQSFLSGCSAGVEEEGYTMGACSSYRKKKLKQMIKRELKWMKKEAQSLDFSHAVEKVITAMDCVEAKKQRTSCPFPLQLKSMAMKDFLPLLETELYCLGVRPEELSLVLENPELTLEADVASLARSLAKGVACFATSPSKEMIQLTIKEVQLDYQLPWGAYLSTVSGVSFLLERGESLQERQSRYKASDFPRVHYLLKHYKRMEEAFGLIEAHYGFFSLTQKRHTYILPRFLCSLQPTLELFAGERLSFWEDISALEDQAFLAEACKQTGWSRNRLESALRVSKYYHRHEYRKSGEPFYHHGLAVASLLLKHTKKEAVIVAALLHDIVDDVPNALAQINVLFGREVARLVDEVTHLYQQALWNTNKNNKEQVETLLSQAKADSLLIKLADRQHNIETLNAHPSAPKRKRIAQETLDFYVPAAELLGKKEMEETLRYLAEEMLEREAQGEV